MGKTWGPFTGRQLTTIVVALIIGVVMLPGAVWAVDSFTNVAIQDPATGAKASVDSLKRLKVGDGSGSLTVDGTVTSHETPLSQLGRYRVISLSANAGCLVLATPPANKAVVLRTVHVNVYDDPSPGFANWVALYSDTTCSNFVANINPGSVGVTTLPFDPGVSSRTGFSVQALGQVQAEVYAFGFTVAATSVPASESPSAAEARPNQ